MNIYKQLLALLPSERLDVGTITQLYEGAVLVELLSGGYVRVLGTGNIGSKVFIKAGQVVSTAPDLTGSIIEI